MDAPIQLYEESTITNGYVKVDTYGTFYKNLGTLGEFFVKVNVSYFGNVSNRVEDIIGISNSDNVQIKLLNSTLFAISNATLFDTIF